MSKMQIEKLEYCNGCKNLAGRSIAGLRCKEIGHYCSLLKRWWGDNNYKAIAIPSDCPLPDYKETI